MISKSAEQNRFYHERKKLKYEDVTWSSTSADISDSDLMVHADTVALSEEFSVHDLWEARWKTYNIDFKNMSTNSEF